MVTTKDIQVLDMFMQAHDIPYVLTGTAALMVHGILPEGYVADDIDIIVLVNQNEDSNKFNLVEKTLFELQSLSGEKKNADYNSVITFRANGVKVNAFMGGKLLGDNKYSSCDCCCVSDVETYFITSIGDRQIKLSSVLCVLKAKFGLKRIKDYKFAKDLASTILNIGF